MNETKYTPDVIAEALEACSSEQSCRDCPLSDDKPACGRLNRTAAEAIRSLAKQVEAQRWIPTSERLPEVDEDDVEVLVMIKGAKESTTLYANDEGEFYAPDDNGGTFYLVTHWRPMPPGPEVPKK